MNHRTTAFVALVAATLLSCGESDVEEGLASAKDRAVIVTVLQDVMLSRKANTGDRQGVLELAPLTVAHPKEFADRKMNLRANIAAIVDAKLVESFVQRNEVAQPVEKLVVGLPWVRVLESSE